MGNLSDQMKQELRELCGSILFDEPLSKYTSIRIGGPADVFAYPQTVEELSSLLAYGRRHHLPVFVLGAGSNLLVRDRGLRGLVVCLTQGFGKIQIEREEAGTTVVYAEAGVGLPRLIDFAAEEGLTGFEPLAGIPGNLGGSLSMNAGTREGEVSDHCLNVTFMNREGRLATWAKEEIGFGYRESHFPKGSVILSARFNLSRLSSELVRGRVQKNRGMRLETQPLNVPNLGSVFKNPVGARSSRPGAKTPPLHAGRLIEETGLKDIRVGGARVSPKHANFIVNEGGAKAKDVLALIGLIRDKVKEKFGVLLEPEVKVVGSDD